MPSISSGGGGPADLAFIVGWVRATGDKLSRGRRLNIETLEDGRAHLTVEYPSMGELLAVLEEIDAMVAMSAEHGAATAAPTLAPMANPESAE